jgi:hypothetical protein
MHDLLMGTFGIPLVICLLFLVFYITDKIWQAGQTKSKSWWKRHIVDDFPYPVECWVCNRTDCVDCPVLKKEEK